MGERDTAPDDAALGRAVLRLLDARHRFGPADIAHLVELVAELLEASVARVHVADYALQRFRVLDAGGPRGESYAMEGTLAGRTFATGEIATAEGTLWVPLVDGTERLGVLELIYSGPDFDPPRVLVGVTEVLVLLITAIRRYTDVWMRTRRAQQLSAAAEAQWDLLPPLSSAAPEVSVSGILEPAYEIGGDSFDYALNSHRLEFTVIDAIGHGMSAVLMSTAVINSLRNTRREGASLVDSYRQADQIVEQRFGSSNYVTGHLGSLELATGELTWLNAGHVLPLLIRNGSYVGEMQCAPSMPIGLGGRVVEVASETLQRGDRVLFYTDGITESRSPDGSQFGHERLADFVVRATLDGLPAAETVRRLSAHVCSHVGDGLNDDATLFLVEFTGSPQRDA